MIFRLCLFLLTFIGLCNTTALAAETAPPAALHSLSPMLQKTMPTVVNIANMQYVDLTKLPLRKRRQLPQNVLNQKVLVTKTSGSGIIINADKGYILTNEHVIRKAQKVVVTLKDGRQFTAKVVGGDDDTDIAVVQIKADHLSALSFPQKNETLAVGDYVVAIGNPYGLNQTVTSGIISALGRNDVGIEGIENFIQIDAPINPGNSGGALVNLRGELIGINTAILSPRDNGSFIGIGFAIPYQIVSSVMNQLIQYGKVSRGQLGVYAQDLTPELRHALHTTLTQGALVSEVLAASPASAAGLRQGDIITRVNDKAIQSSGDLRNAIGLLRTGDTAQVVFYRQGKKQQTIKIKMLTGKQRNVALARNAPYLTGATLRSLSFYSPSRGLIEGVQVANLSPNSLAWNAGLRQGDIIRSVNGRTTKTLAELVSRMRSAKAPVILNVSRGQGAMYLVLKTS